MASGVYKIVNLINGKIYIGSAKNLSKRRQYHFWCLRNNRHCNGYLQNAFNKHGESNFVFDTIEGCEADSCVIREQFYIDLYCSFKPEIGYNICEKAGSILGIKRSEETKAKIGKSNAEKRLTADQKSHLSKINKGKSLSEECKEKIRKGNIGKTMSQEAKSKISKGNKNKPKSNAHKKSLSSAQKESRLNGVKIAQYDKDGNLIKIHDKAIEAAKSVGFAYTNLYQHLRGSRKHIKGFIFKYYKEAA